MADPVTLAAIGMTAGAAGAGVSAYGSLLSGDATAAQLNYQAGIARINQNIAKQNADYAISVGEVQAQESGMQTRAVLGEEKAGQGAGNLDVGSGSALAVRKSTTDIGAENEGILRSDAAKRAYGFQVEGVQQEAQANVLTMGADKSKTAGQIGAVSSILGGVSSVASKWSQASTAGIGSSSGVNPDSWYGQNVTYRSSVFNG